MKVKIKATLQSVTLAAALLGLGFSYFPSPFLFEATNFFSELFIQLLKLISLPLVFLSIVAACSRMDKLSTLRTLGSRVVFYTISTTLAAASVALTLYLLLLAPHPFSSALSEHPEAELTSGTANYWLLLRQAIPSHIFEPFLTNNVLGVLFLGLLVGGAVIALPAQHRGILNDFFSGLFALSLKIAQLILYLMPIAVFSFVVLFCRELQSGAELRSILRYASCIVAANLVQAFAILPLCLLARGISPRGLARAMWPALTLAFFSKSSAAAMPLAIDCAENRAGLRSEVTRFAFPLCTTMNMNACAAFILITVLFVSASHGVVFSPWELLSWLIIASIAAMGNAAVPMGCYFLASSFLAANQVPLSILGIILPFYTVLDMLETAINVWSDACVTAMVDQDDRRLAGLPELSFEAL